MDSIILDISGVNLDLGCFWRGEEREAKVEEKGVVILF